MRLLLVNQFYPPDVAPTGQLLHDLARCLVARGHRCDVLCSRRSYEGGVEFAREELLDGVRVRRVSSVGTGRRGVGRVADYLSFHLAAAAVAAGELPAYDVTLCLTTPPYIGWTVPRALGQKRGAVAHWVMDLYPDVLTAHGPLRPGGVVDRVLRRLMRRQLRDAALVLTLGPQMREKVRAHAGPAARLEYVPLWAPEAAAPDGVTVTSWRERRGWAPTDLVLLYSGNMGLGHRLDEFLAAADRLAAGPQQRSSPRIIWAFAGGGVRRAEVERFAGEHPRARVQLWPYVSRQELAGSLSAADVHLVSLRSPWHGLIVPSKVQAAFELGRPVLFVGPSDSEPADWLAASGGGWVVKEGDVQGLLGAVHQATDASERARRGHAAQAFASEHFDRERNTARIAEILESLVRSPGAPQSVDV